MIRVLTLLCLMPLVAVADVDLPLPTGAIETARQETTGTYALPIGKFTPDRQPAEIVEGNILTRAWRLPPEQAGTLRLSRALRDELIRLEFTLLFECGSQTCGGYDFRFNLPVLPQPEMTVDLNDFFYVSAKSSDAAPIYLGVLISRSDRGGHVQITEVTGYDAPQVELVPPKVAVGGGDRVALGTALQRDGRAVLHGISFASGSVELADSNGPALTRLAALLEDQPEVQLLIVGHSDNEGSLAANINLSRDRAAAVRSAMIAEFGVAPDRLEAAGAGFLAPLAPNTTDEGRMLNRRVEIVLK